MAEDKRKKYNKYNKRYYWLKFKEDFFEEDTIKWLEEQEGGKDIVYFYLKLCSKVISSDGILIRKVGEILIPYDEKGIAKLTTTDINTVRVAISVLKEIKLIQFLENGAIFLPQIPSLIGTESNKAEYMRRKRAREKLTATKETKQLNIGNNVTNSLPICYTDIDTDIDTNIDTDIDIEKEDRIGFDNINLYLNNIELLQNATDEYNTTLKLKKVYLESTTYMPQDLINKYKLYQFAIKRFVDNKQTALLDKINLPLLEKVFVQVSKTKNIDNIVEYYISSVINELTRR